MFRIKDQNGICIGADAIGLDKEERVKEMFHPFEPYKSLNLEKYNQEPLLKKVMEHGEMNIERRSLKEISEYSFKRLSELPIEYKRFNNPHIYKIGISALLRDEREKLIKDSKQKLG